MSASQPLTIASLPLMDTDLFQSHGYPHDLWTRLRHEEPIARIESGPIPFWAITKHADITTVGRTPETFISSRRIMIREDVAELFDRPPTIIEMDLPEHRPYRKIISRRFTPRALLEIREDVERVARNIVDTLFEKGDQAEVDFVEEVAAPLPITVIGWLLGVPESDWHLLYEWTNRMIGSDDPDMHPEGTEGTNDGGQAIIELFQYFAGLLEEKKKKPADDLLSLLGASEVEGKPLEPLEALSYCLALVVAGNETTRNATSGGMLALVEHPEERSRLRADPTLLRTGIEEMLRWSSPLIHFARTASRDTTLGGVRIREGDALALFYPSANRDEEVFEEPFRFDVARTPNHHLAFGVGEHFCAGAHVARLELEMAFKYLMPRLLDVELAGPVERLRSNFVGGIKKLPIRFKLSPA